LLLEHRVLFRVLLLLAPGFLHLLLYEFSTLLGRTDGLLQLFLLLLDGYRLLQTLIELTYDLLILDQLLCILLASHFGFVKLLLVSLKVFFRLDEIIFELGYNLCQRRDLFLELLLLNLR